MAPHGARHDDGHMTSAATAHLFDHAVAGATRWLDEVADALGTDDHRHARRVLRAVLHAVRDRLEPNEAAQLAAQLPELVRGMYYDGWSPSHRASRRREAFLQSIADAAGLHGPTEASFALAATMTVLRNHVSAGELDDVLAALPAELRELLAA